MNSEKRWVVLFVVIEIFWIVILFSLVYQWIYKSEINVNAVIDLNFVTFPLILLILVFIFALIFIYCTYFVVFNKIKNNQVNAYKTMLEGKLNCNKEFKNENKGVEFKRYLTSEVTDGDLNKNLLCSIIIPSRNEENVIRNTVLNCLSQTYSKIEVVVICHNCSDNTFQNANVADNRVKIFNYTTKEAGKGLALNYGVAKANGEFLLILDGDGRLSSDFIEKALPLLFQKDISAIQGMYVPSNRQYNLLTRLISIEGDLWSTPYMTARSYLQKKVYLGGTGYIIKKTALLNVGGFTNHLVDDYELSCRLFKYGHKVLFAPLSINYDEKPGTFDVLIRQRARWSRGFMDLLKERSVKVTDVLGFIYWLTPLAALAGFIILTIYGYAAIHNLIIGYYPYSYAYLPVDIWLPLTGIVIIMQSAVLTKEYGRKGLNYSLYLTIYIAFSLYFFVAYIKSFFVKSWGNTKTLHGFTKQE
jgi:poly-beta-1,6-N-acetyl-D-glucosamine synthase